MLDELCVKDVLIKIDDYPNIFLHAPIGEAFHIMNHQLKQKSKYRTILVMDDNEHLMGYLSVLDMIRAVGPDYMKKKEADIKSHQPYPDFEQDLTALSLIWQEGFTLKVHDELAKPVCEYMTEMKCQLSPDDPIAKSLYIMNSCEVLVLPVVDNEQVIGVVRLIDLFSLIADNVERTWYPHKD